jgi:hypothetical protein
VLRTELEKARQALCQDPRDCEEMEALAALIERGRERMPALR